MNGDIGSLWSFTGNPNKIYWINLDNRIRIHVKIKYAYGEFNLDNGLLYSICNLCDYGISPQT